MHVTTFQKENWATLKIVSLHFAAAPPPPPPKKKKKKKKFNANFTYIFVIFRTKTNCRGKQAEHVELAAISHNISGAFTKFILPKFDFNEHASSVNRFHITASGNERILYSHDNQLEPEYLIECLRSFA